MAYFEDLDLAVQAATQFGLCNPEELQKLADKVEMGADSCLFEIEPDLCQKEMDDRLDVAEVLRMQAELALRMEAIEGSSLFVGDVRDEHMIREREEVFDALAEDGI